VKFKLKILVLTVLTALTSVGGPAYAQEPTFGDALDFVGTWKNVDSGSNNIKKVKITPSNALGSPVSVHAWGKCGSSLCDQGTVAGHNGPSGTRRVIASFFAKNSQGYVFAQRTLTLQMRADGDLDYRLVTHYVDHSGREDWARTGRLTPA
jgi:hypothetical protein